MNKLEIAFINVFSPYKVWNKGEILFFETDNGCRYSIDFEVVEHPVFNAYWFSLTNLDQIASHHDIKIMQTVFCVIDEFFRSNPDILLYMCSTAGEQQAQRARLFSYWFNKAGQQERYYFKTAEIKGEEPGTKEYVAIIVPRNHPQAEDVVAWFDHDTQMFDSMKPSSVHTEFYNAPCPSNKSAGLFASTCSFSSSNSFSLRLGNTFW